MGIKDREANRARQALSGMFSTSQPQTEPVEKNEETAVDTPKTVTKPRAPASTEPKRRGRPAVQRETKKRFTLTLLPSVYDEASRKAYEEGKTLSEVVNDYLAKYINQ